MSKVDNKFENEVIDRERIEQVKNKYNLKASEELKCACCGKRPQDIEKTKYYASHANMSVEEFVKTDGTYSEELNMFVCDDCYGFSGSPAFHIRDIKNKTDYIISKMAIIAGCIEQLND